MYKIYEVSFDDRDKNVIYQELLLNEKLHPFKSYDEALSFKSQFLTFKGVPKTEWVPPKMRSYYPMRVVPDFWWLGPGTGAYAVGEKAMATGELELILIRAGQLLPLPYKNETLTIFNILECVDCVNEEKTEFKPNVSSPLQKSSERPFFVADDLPESSLFKIPYNPTKIYTWELEGDNPEEEFKACVEMNNLKGLKFELIWTEADGIIPYVPLSQRRRNNLNEDD